MATVVLSAIILFFTGSDTFGFWESLRALRVVLVALGVAFIALGLLLMGATIRFFVTVVRGTLAGS